MRARGAAFGLRWRRLLLFHVFITLNFLPSSLSPFLAARAPWLEVVHADLKRSMSPSKSCEGVGWKRGVNGMCE
jgi:hypothetical protein